MRDILEEIDRWQAEHEDIALATLVSAWGSAPRQPGARFAMTRSGRLAGSISGGCVEGDVFARAIAVLDSGRPQLLQYGISDDMAYGVGLSCGGMIEVLVEPFSADAAWTAARGALAERRPCVLATAVAPDELAGRRLCITADGATAGNIHPELDSQITRRAPDLMVDRSVEVVSGPFADGTARVLLEGIAPSPRLLIVGATHVAVALARQAKQLGFAVSVIDARSLFATAERFPDVDELMVGWPEEAMEEMGLDAYSYVAVLTHDIKFDIPALEAALRSDACYIGFMGSRATLADRTGRLRERGFDERALARIHAPIGLDLGGRTPEEIALAIAAEMTVARYGTRRGAPSTTPEKARDEAATV